MARIKITDLPHLQDLTEEQLKELFGAGAKSYRPTVESLEDRRLMSGLTLLPSLTSDQRALISTPIAQTSTVTATTPVISIQDQSSTNPFATIQNQTIDPSTPIDTSFQPALQQQDAALLNSIGGQSILSDANPGPIAIAKKVSELGASLGKPLSDTKTAMPADNFGIGWYQSFEGGKEIVYSPNTGPHLVTGLIRDKYNSLGGPFTFGYPKTDDVVIVGEPGDVRVVNDFTVKGGIASIVWSSRAANVGPQVIYGGDIWNAWVTANATNYSVPVSGEYVLRGGGHAQEFLVPKLEDGYYTFTWSENAGTKLVSGEIRDKWNDLNEFGAAINYEDVFGTYAGHILRYQNFTVSKDFVGTIVFDVSTRKANEVHGAIWQKWADLGFFAWGTPISDETSINSGKVRYNDFLAPDGIHVSQLVWYESTGQVVIKSNVGIYSGTQSLSGASMNLAPQGFGLSGAGALASTTAPPTGSIDFTAPYEYATDATWAGYYLSSPIVSVADQGQWANNAAAFGQILTPGADSVLNISPAPASVRTLDASTLYTPITSDVGLGQEILSGLTPSTPNVNTPGAGLSRDIGSISPVFSVPQKNSNLGAAKTIYLDFLGGPVGQDFLYQKANVATSGGTADAILNSARPVNLRNFNVPTFDLDGKSGSFSAEEQAVITEIWQRVAEDFAPFNVNVTTEWSGALNDPNMLRIIIGGPSIAATGMADPYGLSQLDSMKQGGPNVAFVFSDSIKTLGGHFATLAANVASREAGHAFGLRYQLQNDSTSGKSDVSPQANIMGTRIGVELTRWAQQAVAVPSDVSPNAWAWQDDLRILTGALGLRDQGQFGGFTNLGNVDAAGTVQGQGTIVIPFGIRQAENPGPAPVDVDTYIFDTQGGRIQFTVQGIGAGQNLRAHFEVWASDTKLGESPTLYGELNAALTLNLPAGTYTVKVMGSNEYGNYGQYTLSIQKGSVIDLTGAYQTRSAIAPEMLQNRLVELDQAIDQSQQDLQGALDLQAQYTAEGERIATDIQAATDLSPDETAPELADLQARQAQNAAALEQNQQQMVLLQIQLDLFTTEQTLIGSTLADADAAQARQATDFTGATFSLTSLDSGNVHQLQIQDQSNSLPAVDSVHQQYPDGTATFNGTWDGQSVTGTLAHDDAGNVRITFSLSDGSSVDGTLSGQPGAYHFEGMLAPADGSSAIAVTGDQDATPAAAVPSVQDLTAGTFTLTGADGVTHQLAIQTQTAMADGSATFTGLWDADTVAGTLAYDEAGNIHIAFSLSDGSSVDGILSGQPGAYHYDGMRTPADGSNPIAVAVDQDTTPVTPVTDFTSVTFAWTDEGGAAHQLQITDQSAQPDGTATFNGVWDGQSVAGTLAYDAAGNVQIVFSADNGICDATIAGNPGAFQIDGSLTMPGGDTLTVAGIQIA
jgi:hypothetical protein